MNTILKTLALVLAAAVPAAFVAESVGVALPTVLETGKVFGAFGVVLMVLTLSTDYRAPKPLAACARTSLPLTPRSNLRLAA